MTSRIARHHRVVAALDRLTDAELGALVDGAQPLGTGIGGTAVRLDVDGVPVFVKRLPLTDRERRPENVRSTANLFGLPPFCHYGVGGPGFGAWRELAANVITTGWVLDGRCPSFPILHHWRVLPGAPAAPDEHADVDAAVAYWEGAPQVRERIDAVANASAGLLLFLEFVPANLQEWLNARLAARDEGEIAAACAMVERELRTAVPFMAANGLVHFDAHFRNILTDGERLYLADLGLAASTDFTLDGAERAFLHAHSTHDGANVLALFVYSLVAALTDVADWRERFALIGRWAEGDAPVGIPAAAVAVVERYAPIAVVMNDFYLRLLDDSRATPYPAAEVERAYRAATTR